MLLFGLLKEGRTKRGDTKGLEKSSGGGFMRKSVLVYLGEHL